jgi:hypothetical protein
VPVAVGLDHGTEANRVTDLGGKQGAVALDGGEVDPGDCPRHG